MSVKRHVIVAGCVLALAGVSSARAASYETAQTLFNGLPLSDRAVIPLMLIAIGDYNGLTDGHLNHRIYRAIIAFQSRMGNPPTGVLTRKEADELRSAGFAFANRIGLKEIKYPDGSFSLFVPTALLGPSIYTDRGIALEAPDKSAAVDFSRSRLALPELFRKLSTDRRDRKVTYKASVADFIVVSGIAQGRKFYTRYQNAPNGAIGFTFSWDPSSIANGDRIAVLMSNLFLPAGNSAEVEPPGEASSSTAPSADAQPESTIYSGTGFFVSSDGVLITNQHVVASCHSIVIVGRGSGVVKATDPQNDLALIQVSGPSAPAHFRESHIKLGEAIYVLGFPLAGTLDNGLNITNGMVSSLSGIQNDSRYVQITAPVQPGNSGGPVVDSQGLVTGIATGRLNDLTILKQSGAIPQNVNFAIRADMLLGFLRANGLEPLTDPDGAPLAPPEIASAARSYAVQIMCTN